MPRLPPVPELDWSDPNAPRAVAFDDTYFSRDGGLAEADAVFLAGCGLPEGWSGRDHFSICELGFGSGLNVLAAWRAWKSARKPHAILHIFSVEAFPLERADAARALARFPEISDLAERLLARWPVRAYAPQRLWFEEDGLALTLHVGQAENVLAGMSGKFDAWFLDGFAPNRNSSMWRPAMMRRIAQLSASGARLATFSVAGDVRRGLEQAGFEVAKKPGFAGKRERLEARYSGAQAQATHTLYPYAACAPKRVAIIGAGIAGAATAAALARRNVETIVLDAAGVGAGASGNPAGIVMPRFDRGGGALNEIFLAAFLSAVAAYEKMDGAFTCCGVEERPEARNLAALADLIADPPLPADWFSALEDGAVLHSRGGLVRPAAAIAEFLRAAELMSDAPVGALERVGDGWTVFAPDGKARLKADAVVLACGPALTRFEAARFLPIELSRGQMEWGAGPKPARAITRGSFLAPFDDGIMFGATFDRLEAEGAVVSDDASRRRNLNALARLEPKYAELDPAGLSSRAALRTVTPDRAPIAGLLPDAPVWLAQNEGIAQGLKPALASPAPAHHGVYVLGGLGARGFTLAPLLGERIAAEMCGEPHALSMKALDAIHPARFLHRALRKRS